MPSDYSVEETMCVADEMVWRKTFGREVMRLVMQQPQSGPILQRMRQVQEKGAGFVLASTATVKVKDSSGDHTFRRELKTDSLALDQEIDDLQLALPKGYELFDPSMLLSSVAPKAANAPAQAQVAAGQTGEDKNPAEAKGDKSLRETLQTAFFSVLSYGLAPN